MKASDAMLVMQSGRRGREAAAHRCQPPTLAGMTRPIQPDWECGECARVWRDMGPIQGWAEIRGPAAA